MTKEDKVIWAITREVIVLYMLNPEYAPTRNLLGILYDNFEVARTALDRIKNIHKDMEELMPPSAHRVTELVEGNRDRTPFEGLPVVDPILKGSGFEYNYLFAPDFRQSKEQSNEINDKKYLLTMLEVRRFY